MMNENQLLELRQEIDTAKNKEAEFVGEKKAILASLLERFDCRTLKEAEAKAAKLQIEIDTAQAELDKGIADIEEKYGKIQ